MQDELELQVRDENFFILFILREESPEKRLLFAGFDPFYGTPRKNLGSHPHF